MLEFRELVEEDKERIERYAASSRISFHRFSNMFMWRKVMRYQICESNGVLYVIERYRDQVTSAFMPFCREDEEREALGRLIRERPDLRILRLLTQEQAGRVEEWYPDALVYPIRGQWDYIYRTKDLISLRGRAYHGKKNHLNAFRSSYRFAYHDITSESGEAGLELLRNAEACLYHPEPGDVQASEEHDANLALIALLPKLDLRAAVLTVEGVPVAYTIGERTFEDTALIHVEKADRSYKGAYAAINQMFCERAWADTSYLNREEDMGMEGIRRAKLSYHPFAMNEVYAVRLFPEAED